MMVWHGKTLDPFRREQHYVPLYLVTAAPEFWITRLLRKLSILT